MSKCVSPRAVNGLHIYRQEAEVCENCGESKSEKKYIDLTPTWSGIVEVLLELNRVPAKREFVREEFKKMAAAADKWNEHCKQLKEDLE